MLTLSVNQRPACVRVDKKTPLRLVLKGKERKLTTNFNSPAAASVPAPSAESEAKYYFVV